MRTNVEDLKGMIGGTLQEIFLVSSMQQKLTTTGKAYLDLTVSDITGEINGKVWDFEDVVLFKQLKESPFVYVEAEITEYKDQPQLRFNYIEPLQMTNPRINLKELVPAMDIDSEKYWNILESRVNKMDQPDLHLVCSHLLMDNKEILMRIPAAQKVHQAKIHGLLDHLVGMVQLADTICQVIPQANADLLVAGVLVHDIGKKQEYLLSPTGLVAEYSTAGRLLGHITLGIKYLSALCEEIRIPTKLQLLLEHMLLSHHGKPEYGSPVPPQFLEAELLHMIDNLNAKADIYKTATESLKAYEWSPRIFGLENRSVFKIDLNDLEDEPQPMGFLEGNDIL